MFEIFAFVYDNDKLVKSFDYKSKLEFKGHLLFTYLQEICYNLDIAVPVVLKPHINNLTRFNHVKFLKDDFVEPFRFSKLVLQKYEE